MRALKIAQLHLDDGTQTRAQVDQETVDKYAEAMRGENAQTFPPIIVFEDEDGRLVLADGFHRVDAARKNGQLDIMAKIHRGSRVDALRYSLGANNAHGLPRTNADKRRSVELALGEAILCESSNREIARLCGVGHQLVDTVRREQEKNVAVQVDDSSTSKSPTKRIGGDGKMHPASRSKPAKKPAPQVSEPSSSPLKTVVADILADEYITGEASDRATTLQASNVSMPPQTSVAADGRTNLTAKKPDDEDPNWNTASPGWKDIQRWLSRAHDMLPLDHYTEGERRAFDECFTELGRGTVGLGEEVCPNYQVSARVAIDAAVALGTVISESLAVSSQC